MLTTDEIGNLLYDGTWNYVWEHGRQLEVMSKADTYITYGYSAVGMRSYKIVNGLVYYYHYVGDQLVEMTWGSPLQSSVECLCASRMIVSS